VFSKVRYLVAVLMIATVPPSITLWYAIHPFARAWRRVGMRGTYAVLSVPAGLIAWAAFHYRLQLLGSDLGSHPALLVLVVVAAATAAVISRHRRRLLTQRILMGGPELSSTDTGRLFTEGIYSRMRNPRYLEFVLFLLAYVAFANYAGTWVLLVLAFPAIHLVVLLEERELRDRFGTEYDEYCRRVPRYLPRSWRS
jgi:protein-S-isoprenylcysteine O-methyltransferase Ste14